MLAVCILMRGRDEINNALAAGTSPLPRARPIFPLSLPLSSACHAGYFDDDLHALSPLKVSKENTFTHEIKL